MKQKKLYDSPFVESSILQTEGIICTSGDIESAALWGIVNAQENDLTMLGFE